MLHYSDCREASLCYEPSKSVIERERYCQCSHTYMC